VLASDLAAHRQAVPSRAGDGRSMPIHLEERVDRPAPAMQVCATDGMPLFPTIVGPRCPLCGAATPR
jgi:hypothetical protein